MYEESDVPTDALSNNSSLDIDASTGIFFSDHFDCVHHNSLIQNTDSCRVKIETLLPMIKGAYSNEHQEILHRRSIESFITMLKRLEQDSIENLKLSLFKNIDDCVSCILPGGIDSSLERAADLSGVLWSGGCNLKKLNLSLGIAIVVASTKILLLF